VRISRAEGRGACGGEELARDIARFAQVCVRADRRSSIKSHVLSVREALIQEWYNGREALIKDGSRARAALRPVSGAMAISQELDEPADKEWDWNGRKASTSGRSEIHFEN
jgi:hypothetical protein